MSATSNQARELREISDRLERAWVLRISQDIESCLALQSRIRQELGLPVRVSGADEAEKCLSVSDAHIASLRLSALVLSASLSRAVGRLSRAREEMSWIDLALSRSIIDPPSRFYLEKGLNDFAQGDYASALDHFMTARFVSQSKLKDGQESHSEEQRVELLSSVNLLLCFENLGLPFERIYKEILERSAEFRERKDRDTVSWWPAVQAQLDAFEMRRMFHEGRLSELISVQGRSSKSLSVVPMKLTQPIYFSTWLKQLPYHVGASNVEIEPLMSPSHLFQKGYRFRTLAGVLHPDDRGDIKPSEIVDRLYLWVWRWVTDSERFSVEKVLSVLDEALNENKADRLTGEDRLLLRNALLWLMLFDGVNRSRLLEKIQAIPLSSGVHSPILELEYLTNQFINQRRYVSMSA